MNLYAQWLLGQRFPNLHRERRMATFREDSLLAASFLEEMILTTINGKKETAFVEGTRLIEMGPQKSPFRKDALLKVHILKHQFLKRISTDRNFWERPSRYPLLKENVSLNKSSLSRRFLIHFWNKRSLKTAFHKKKLLSG